MITATKVFTFDAGHRLMKHQGKCHNLHGHTYKLEVTVMMKTGGLGKNGMVFDFGDLKKIVNNIIDLWDHAMVFNKEDHVNIDHCQQLGYKVSIMEDEPTAENMAILLQNKILNELPDDMTVNRIVLWETPTSYAEVF